MPVSPPLSPDVAGSTGMENEDAAAVVVVTAEVEGKCDDDDTASTWFSEVDAEGRAFKEEEEKGEEVAPRVPRNARAMAPSTPSLQNSLLSSSFIPWALW
mmetsp:Transcript_29408/g.60671  ORF Transcript_29408/g.60671 Transcript_29408/m.60671 type:complete len:100 (+) Transcript_29408:248-547(+)